MSCFEKRRLIVILFLLAPGGLFSRENTADHPLYQLIRTIETQDPVKQWVFPAGYPAVAVRHNQISAFTQTGQENILFPLRTGRVVFSRSARYYGIIEQEDSGAATQADQLLQITLYNADNLRQYTLRRELFYDDSFPLLIISDRDGALIIGQNSTGEVRFYDRHGRLLKQVELFPGSEYDLERVLSIDISADGRFVAIAAGKRGASPAGSEAGQPSAEPYLWLFSPAGEEIWRTALPGFNTRSAVISDDGSAIAVNSYTIDMQGTLQKQTLVYDKAGREITRVPSLFKQARFSPDGGFLVLAEGHSLIALELPAGKVSWQQNIPGKESLITAVETAASGKTTVLLLAKNQFKDGAFGFSEPTLLMLNRSGEIVQRLDLRSREFSIPSLQLSADAEKILVGFKHSYQIYRVQP